MANESDLYEEQLSYKKRFIMEKATTMLVGIVVGILLIFAVLASQSKLFFLSYTGWPVALGFFIVAVAISVLVFKRG